MRVATGKQVAVLLCLLMGAECVLGNIAGIAQAVTLKVMTFNIKNASTTPGFDQEQSWDYVLNNSNDRRDRVVSVINSASPDILGVQELKLGQLSYLDDYLADYSYYGVGRDTGTNSDPGERAGIFYKKSRLRPLAQGQFWLSETPSVPGTMFVGNGGDTNNARMATWMKLFDSQSNETYFVVNTHWSLDNAARAEAGMLIREMISELSDGLPIIVTGDFNETATGTGYALLAPRQALRHSV